MEPRAPTSSSTTALNVVIVASAVEHATIAAAARRLDIAVQLRTTTTAGAPPHVIIIALDADGTDTNGHALIARHAIDTPMATIVALLSAPTPATIVAAMRAGATEVLPSPVREDSLARALEKSAAVRTLRTLPQPDRPTDGQVTTVLAPKEGVGATTLVANLGIELGRTYPHQVALMDLDLRHGDLALLLNVDPPQSLADLALGVASLDAVFVHGSLVQHPTGLSLLAASSERSREAPEFSPAHVEHVLGILRAAHRFVLVDAPPPLSDTALAAVRCAARVLLPTEPTVPCLRAAWRTIEALERHGIPTHTIDVIVTRHESTEALLGLDEIADALGRPVAHVLPREDDTACRAINSGLPIASVHVDGPLHHAIATLAATFIPSVHAHATHEMSASSSIQ